MSGDGWAALAVAVVSFISLVVVAAAATATHLGYRWTGRIRYPPKRKVHTCTRPWVYSDPIYHAPDGTTFTCRFCKTVWTLHELEWLSPEERVARLERDLDVGKEEG